MPKKIDNIKRTPAATLSTALKDLCASVTAKRPKTVIDHILKHGIITSEDIAAYGYNHEPRAVRDVRDHGIPLITHSITNANTGRRMGAYTFGDPSDIKKGRIGGRKAFSKAFKEELIAKYGSRDAFTNEQLEPRYLQIDHRIPYEVAGDAEHQADPDAYMLIDASSQRSKSWSCEQCVNWLETHDPEICRRCFWAFPENYDHVAMIPERRLNLAWRGEEATVYDALESMAKKKGLSVADQVKELIELYHNSKNN